ncbi:MAG: TetM/TetW/TetO/TetS family tetracycline resistance ribosomal protection protein, partial [Eubacteriales bacterium]|nr:TetM/TetW/TetO/TetS family tetracycline resistance ribosomal protection protein [Eubacteriales bacterium]
MRNIGVFAHVDAGKTSLTERMLSHCGAIRKEGSVDAGTAHTDNLDIERRRGISVRSACAPMQWKHVEIRLLDTPGHADFAAEIERAMWALDGAVVLLSAAEGVQPQTELICEALRDQAIPYLFFINKCDRADPAEAIAQAQAQLSACAVDIRDDEAVMALLAEEDEQALEAYISGEIYARDRLLSALGALTKAGKAHPIICGSALQDEGVEALLDAVCAFLPAPGGDANGPLCGIVFSLDHSDPVMGRAARVRLFSGALKNREPLLVPTAENEFGVKQPPVERKVTQIRALSVDGKGKDLGEIKAGDIALVYGLGDIRTGAILGDEALLGRKASSGRMKEPLITVSVEPDDPKNAPALDKALQVLCAEDPLLGAVKTGGGIQMRITGRIQLDVVSEMLESRWGLKVSFGPPKIIYRETIREAATGFYAYTMPKPCWAIIEFWIEPLPRGSGVVFESVVPSRDIMPRYQHQVQQAIPLAIRQGMLGWRVDDVKITLVGGNHHLIHTHPLDFIVATPVAFLDGLRRGGSVLLEPMLSARITVPADTGGKVLARVAAMRGEVTQTESAGESVRMTATIPAATSVDFPTELSILSGGRGALSMQVSGYRECEMREGATCERVGVHPLDTSKYILAA